MHAENGGDSGGATPLPIPNREVKPASADGTRRATSRESRSPPILTKRGPSAALFSWYEPPPGTARRGPVPLHARPVPRADARRAPRYDELQEQVAAACAGLDARRASSSAPGRERRRGGCSRPFPTRVWSGSTRARRCSSRRGRCCRRAKSRSSRRAAPGSASGGPFELVVQRTRRPPPRRRRQARPVRPRAGGARPRAASCSATSSSPTIRATWSPRSRTASTSPTASTTRSLAARRGLRPGVAWTWKDCAVIAADAV